MRILVTGAGGYVGRHLVPKLREAGHEVREFHQSLRFRDPPANAKNDWLFGDLSDSNDVFREMARIDIPDAVIHLAGRVEISLLPNPKGADLPPIPGPCDIAQLYRDNVVATANILDYCLNAGVKHLIFASTQAVYGVPAYGGACDDELLANPLDHYAASKRAAELVLETGRKQGLTISILRLPGVFGGDRNSGVVWNMCRDMLDEGVVYVTANHPLPINVMHIEDVVAALCAAAAWQPLNRCWSQGLTEDITGTEPCSLTLLAHEIASLGPEITVLAGAFEQPVMRLYSPSRLGWSPKPRKERLAQVLEEIRRETTHGDQ